MLFGGQNLFDRIFGGDDVSASPEEAAEVLRQKLQRAAAAGDLATAYRLEKELIQLLAESGVRYIVEEPESTEQESMPKNW